MLIIFIIVFSDQDIEKIRLRDPEVFEKIYNEYKVKLYNFLILKVNGDRLLAEEILSDTIYSALQSAPKIKDKDRIQSWLYQIARRRFYDHLRAKYKNRKIEDSIRSQASQEKSDEAGEDEKIVTMKTAMDNLRPLYRELVRLKYIDDKSQIEIAAIVKKSRSSVESLLFRAREALKEEIKRIYRDQYR